MSYNYNHHLRNNFRGKSTFQSNAYYVPPPPTPPPFFLPPRADEISDEDVVNRFRLKLQNVHQHPVRIQPSTSISKVRDEIRNMALALNEIKLKEKILSENMSKLPDDEWNSNLKIIEENKATVSQILLKINNLNTDVLRKLLAKRSAKRARQKRQLLEKKKHKEEQMILNQEKSRKIDEYLQKFQDDMNKARQEEETKLQADAVLRETTRKKQDAKKYIVKLDALVKLRKARQNTAKGRGENVSEKEMEVFESNIEKLKSMWTQRLAIYEKEETELRAKLKHDSQDLVTKTNETEREVTENLMQWKDVLFGGMLPQKDFGGDVRGFVAVRAQWDQYLQSNGSPVPIGWVPPTGNIPSTNNSF